MKSSDISALLTALIICFMVIPIAMPATCDEPVMPFVSESSDSPISSTDKQDNPEPELIGGYHTYPEIETELNAIAMSHPDICQLFSIGQSWESRNLWVMKVSDNVTANESEPEIFINGGIHAREWIAVEVPLYYLNWLVNNYGSDPQATWLVDNRQIFIAPTVNPDGLVYCQNVGDWRKNRRNNGDGSYGVDLNRNWDGACNGDPDGEWGQGTGISHTPGAETYCGPSSFSEPETQAMRDLILAHDFQVMITYHSYGNELYWPWGYSTSIQTPHDAVLSAMGTAIAAENGYTPMQSSLLYETTGDTDDWTYGYNWYNLGKVVCAHTIELGSSFQPPQGEIISICQANCLANIFATEAAGNIYLDSPAITHTPLSDTLDTAGPYTVSANIATAYGLQPGATKLFWRAAGQPWNSVVMTNTGGNTWQGNIPGQPNGIRVNYYIETSDINSHRSASPNYSPYEYYDFFVGVDTTPPAPLTDLGVEWTGTTGATLIDQDFTSTTFPPTGWAVATSGTTGTWSRQTTANAGGVSPEARFYYGSSGAGTSRFYTGPIDTSGMTSLELQFQQFYDAYDTGVTVKVQTSTDGATWSDTGWSVVGGTVNVGPGLVTETISSAEGAGSATLYIAFVINGDSYQLDYWYVDSVLLTFAGIPTTDNNLLTWTLSADDGGGADDVARYNIYRAVAASGPWDSPALIDSVPAGTTSYQDMGRGESDGTNWWYVVRAEDIWGNEEMNSNAVLEIASGPPYDIPMVGKSAGNWVFVSYPIMMAGPLETVLDDSIYGDGQTTWDIAKWYNPQTPADPWKTYRVGGTANDLTTICNLIGVWLHLTANGGDQLLTTGVIGANPATAVNINLYHGWNLVGYPSQTTRSGSATLPLQADIVSVWQAASPYIADSTPAAVTMSHGNAYWVHVTSDCVWVVNP